MKIYVVDFEEVLKNFTYYHESLKKIQSEKQKFADEIESIKKDMESIINGSKLIIDDKTKMDQALKFKELQAKAIKLESDFRNDIVEFQNKELESNFENISEIVKEWANKAEIDIVINKSQAIYTSDKYNATESIIEALKIKHLYHEYNESEYLVEAE
jgi:Skp family chaperone for outer membrane proteins